MKTFFQVMLMGLLVGGMFAWILFEWAAGCGEHYIDSKGVLHSYECYDMRAAAPQQLSVPTDSRRTVNSGKKEG